MHNSIMAAGSRDRPPMLAPGRYPQWRSRFLRYVDTRPNVPEHTTIKTPSNMSPENKAYFLAKKEAIHLILTRIGDDLYSTVDACQTTHEMWEAIERFMTIVKQQHKLDEVSYYKLFDILKQYQNKVNELRAEKLARNANPLALVATAQASQDPFYQSSRSHRSSAPSPKPSISSRSHTATRHKGKEIAKPITPPSETASEEDSDLEQTQRDKDMQKNLALIAKYFKKIYKPTNNNLRTSSNSKNKTEKVGSTVVQQSGIQCFNCKEYENFAKECKKPKRVKDFAYPKEKMLMCKQADQGVPFQAEHNTCLVETDDSNVIPDSPDMCEDDIQNEHNDVESDDERVALANLKLDVDENKKVQKQLKKANTTLAQELKECKAILAETSKSLEESISVRDSCMVALQTKHAEFEKFKAFNDRTVDYDKLECKLNEALGQLAHKYTVIKEGLKTKAYELLVVKEKHDELMKQSLLTKSHYEGLVKQKMKAQSEISCLYAFPYDQSTHANRLILDEEETLALKRESQSKLNKDLVHMYDVILQDCVSKDVMCSYLQSLSDLDALAELQCMYLYKEKECDCLVQKLSKQTESVSKKVKNNTVCNEKASNVFQKEREQYFKIQDLKAKLEDKNVAISELKKLIEQGKAKSVDTKFDRPSVVRQPNAQRIRKPSVLGKMD
nr:hypothetical protein [Tanacetum cinerariifolium]